MRPSETVALLERVGFGEIDITDTGEKTLRATIMLSLWQRKGELPPFGIHTLLGETAPQKIRNAARNIDERKRVPCKLCAGGRRSGRCI